MEYFSPAIVPVGLTTMVAVVGMPHGGLDHLFGRELFRPFLGRYWLAGFAIAYLGIAGLLVFGWFAFPALTIVMFFLISAVHFGDDAGVRQPLRAVEGGMVIWVPLLFRQTEVAELLAWVVPGGELERTLLDVDAIQPLLWSVASFFLLSLAVGNTFAGAARKLAFATLFAFAPTLISFVVYFCGWHSTRELMELASRADPVNRWRGLLRVMVAAAPMAGLAVAAISLAAWWFAGDRELQPVMVQAVFIGLSAVAMPHILLHAAASRLGADPFSSSSCDSRYAANPERALV